MTLKPCPCGKVPETMEPYSIPGRSFMRAAPEPRCCGWSFQFHAQPWPNNREEAVRLAEEAWNAAPRGKHDWRS